MERGEWIAVAVATLGLGGLGAFAWYRSRNSGPPPAAVDDGIGDATGTTVNQEIEALARAITSEEGASPRAIQTAVGWAILNESIRRGVTLWSLVRGKTGAWGTQGQNGYVSSAQPATPALTELARQIMANEIPDPTNGATQFDRPKLQRQLNAKDPKKHKSPEAVAAARIANGSELVVLPGVNPDDFRMWRPVA